ncbi:PRC-barrel domain-containing protein [Marinobacter fonticola]|uniref:PRC-barrel domain-containing protein n=1 Tax=Marinobacter fonticola TaxID=2603215 RepID=UPI0011E61E8A|nr:PRC-barrel domain-containing protein [Marinobacter fonticola]
MPMQLSKTFKMSLLASGLALGASAHAAEGLYSADDLMDADVYDQSGKEIGEVEDILMGNGMEVHSLVIETGGVLDMGGREVVVERGDFTVKTGDSNQSWDEIDYEVHIDASPEEIKGLDEYSESWWNQTRQSMNQAWENTQEGAASAWENTKEASSRAWQNTKDAVENLGDEVESETDEM